MFQRIMLAALAFALCACLSSVARADDPKLPPEKALEKVLPQITVNAVPLDHVVKFLADITKADFDVDWDELKKAGVAKSAPVTIDSTNKTLREVLTDVLKKVSKDTPLDFATTQTKIKISTKDALK